MKDQADNPFDKAARAAADALGVDPNRSGTSRLARDLGSAVLRQHKAKPRLVSEAEIVVPISKPKVREGGLD